MGRLVDWPIGLRIRSMERLAGPRAIGGAAGTSIGNFTQTVSSPFGLWRLRFTFPIMDKDEARRFRGWVTSLHGGANATRVPWFDVDKITPAQAGLSGFDPQLWSNGQPWANGQNWGTSYPVVSLASNAAQGATVVSLADDFWGHVLGVGDQIGFFPFYFGAHEITEVMSPGTYRVWPSLRKSLTTDDFATVEPVIAMRLEGEDAAGAARERDFLRGANATLVETLDYDVRDYFAG